ncbi:ATP-dependent Clp protease proteolytic subunit [Phaeovulum vinaykumarii]|uniref:Clp protease n=1 Tax=Phaeovulum vinaykumarii TaxID=407234 RepID=A0A1N7JV94_9RHOB|nr:ATP-dependent Clp protease proteolytic subunit [Phaeovulum vinaykumarii]SIS53253.1 Clp protease [Phaeovulum vinaykumarii]SOB91533.1 ClpP protease-like protein [Phaeovulum vinaykumarii]
MHDAAHLMIHAPASLSIGPAEAHRKAADTLEKVAATYARAYARATGHPVERMAEWMKAETWLTAEEAVALHFADEIAGGAVRACALPPGFDLNAFKHTPEAVRGRFTGATRAA